MPKIEAYLALEQTATATMQLGWRKHGTTLVNDLEELISQGKWDDAYAKANSVTLAGVVETQRNRLEELLVSSMLFGASQLIEIEQTGLMRGDLSLPDVLGSALDQLTIMVEDDGADYVRDAANALVAEEEEKARSQALLSKADKAFDLGARLNAAVLGTGKAVVDIGANLTTSRLVSYGFLAQARQMQITTYQVSEVLDSRTCPVCRIMHGKTFQVAQEIARIENALKTIDPQELKALAPWPSQSKANVEKLSATSEAELQSMGLGSPPYHPGCRGVLQKEGTVKELIPTKTVQIRTPVKTKPADDEVPEVQETKITTIMDDLTIQNLIAELASQKLRDQATKAYRDGNMKTLKKILVDAGLLDKNSDLI